MEVPNSVAGLLYEFSDVIPAALLKDLPPRRPIEYWIKLIPGSKPPTLALYQMSLLSCCN